MFSRTGGGSGRFLLGLDEGELEAERQELPLGELLLEELEERVLLLAAVGDHDPDPRAGGPPLGHPEHARDRLEAVDRLPEGDPDLLESCRRLHRSLRGQLISHSPRSRAVGPEPRRRYPPFSLRGSSRAPEARNHGEGADHGDRRGPGPPPGPAPPRELGGLRRRLGALGGAPAGRDDLPGRPPQEEVRGRGPDRAAERGDPPRLHPPLPRRPAPAPRRQRARHQAAARPLRQLRRPEARDGVERLRVRRLPREPVPHGRGLAPLGEPQLPGDPRPRRGRHARPRPSSGSTPTSAPACSAR